MANGQYSEPSANENNEIIIHRTVTGGILSGALKFIFFGSDAEKTDSAVLLMLLMTLRGIVVYNIHCGFHR